MQIKSRAYVELSALDWVEKNVQRLVSILTNESDVVLTSRYDSRPEWF